MYPVNLGIKKSPPSPPSYTPPPPPSLASTSASLASTLLPILSWCLMLSTLVPLPPLVRCFSVAGASWPTTSPLPPSVPSPLVLHHWCLLTTNLSASCCADACSPLVPRPLSFVSHLSFIAPLWFRWLSCHLLSHSSFCYPAPPPLSTGFGFLMNATSPINHPHPPQTSCA